MLCQRLVVFVILTLMSGSSNGMMVLKIPETHAQALGREIVSLKHLGAAFPNPIFTIEWPQELNNKVVPYGWVTIDSDGMVRVAKKFDYEALPEENKNIEFTAVVKRGNSKTTRPMRGHYALLARAGGIHEWKMKVVLEVLDVNDEPPQIVMPPGGLISVPSKPKVGQTFYTIAAVDRDKTSRLKYVLNAVEECGHKFGMNSNTGELFMREADVPSQCHVQVQVTDVASCSRITSCQTQTEDFRILSSKSSNNDGQTSNRRSVFLDGKCPPYTVPDPSNPTSCIDTSSLCQSDPCLHGGTCYAHKSGYECACVLGWTGRHCEIQPTPIQYYNITRYKPKTIQAFKRKETTVYKKKSAEECKAAEYKCRKDADRDELCSGRGHCECGKCWCPTALRGASHWYGKFCECNSWSCPSSDGKMCAGHGVCRCGQCLCMSGWSGDTCDCSTSDDACYPPGGGHICSGRGSCLCGRCQCQPGWAGSACHCKDSTLQEDASVWSLLFCKSSK